MDYNRSLHECRPRWTSTIQLLEREGPLPVIGITDEMLTAGFIRESRDKDDARRRHSRQRSPGFDAAPTTRSRRSLHRLGPVAHLAQVLGSVPQQSVGKRRS